jgi:hypothetical protein
LPAAAPVSVIPVPVTSLPVPTLAVANAAVPVQLTTSPPIAPLSVQIVSAALVVASYTLFAALIVGVRLTAVIAADVVAVVVVNV